MRSPEITATQRRAHLVNAVMSCFIVIPLLSFMVSSFSSSFSLILIMVGGVGWVGGQTQLYSFGNSYSL